MKLKIIGIVVLSLVMVSSAALADSLINTNGASFTAFTTADINQDGTPFWDNASADGGNKNVGYILTGTNTAITGYTTTNWLGANTFSQYLGTAGGGVVNNVYVQTLSNPSQPTGLLIITVAGNSAGNNFGVYDLANATNANFASFSTQLVGGGTANNTPFSVNIPYASYGFYFYDTATAKLFVSDPNTNGNGTLVSADGNSNFAFFQNTSLNTVNTLTYFIGMEDLTDPISGEGSYGCPGLGDYNDMIVEITIPSNVPVPPSALLLGTGLLGLVGMGWRRRNNG